MDDRNAYMLEKGLAKHGFDWWWHSFVGINHISGEKQPFFVEYFVINPGLGADQPVFGQLAENQKQGIKPSYAMLKAGTWQTDQALQIHNFFSCADFSATSKPLSVRIGPHTLTEEHLKGIVCLSAQEAAEHPEYMSQAGEMSWELTARELLSYSVGYGAAPFFRSINAFQMYWHVQGMLTHYSGQVTFNGEVFDVVPESCAGYQDKNWGQDYTNLWIWLNCNHFVSRKTGQPLPLTSLDVGGAEPVMWGRALPHKLLIAFYHEGKQYEFNFSKFWTAPQQTANCRIEAERVVWEIEAWNRSARIKINFSCPRSKMLLVNYENPAGQKRHNHLWNGGWASGSVTLYEITNGQENLVDVFDGDMGGCEYGQADPA